MDPNLYKIIHIVGLAMLFFGLGGMLAPRGKDEKAPGLYGMLHGLGLLAMVVAGFGRAAKMQFPLTSGWLLAKAGLWLFLGALPVLVKKGLVPRAVAWVVAIAVVGAGAWLAIQKPF